MVPRWPKTAQARPKKIPKRLQDGFRLFKILPMSNYSNEDIKITSECAKIGEDGPPDNAKLVTRLANVPRWPKMVPSCSIEVKQI